MTHKKVLGRPDMVLFTISAILLLDTLAATASVGPASIFWWLFLGLVFYLPFALVCAEMGCSYPEAGGIYAWVRDAFGGRWGARITWGYWVNTAVWMPAIFILFAGICKQLFIPGLDMTGQILLGITLSWVAVGANIVTLDVGKWVPNLGAVLKFLIFAALISGALVYTLDHGMANPLSLDTMRPDWGASLQYIPAIIYGMLGFELVSASSEEMKDPARDIPATILISGTVILLLYVLATVAMLAAIPAGEIDLVEGLIDTLRLLFGGFPGGEIFVQLLGGAALYTFFSNGVTWAMGCNRAAAEAGMEGELPAIFAKENRVRGTPAGAAIMMGLVSTLILGLYGFLSRSNEELFWSLFAFSAVIFLLPYIGMMLAFLKMRRVDANHVRPFRIPGGQPVAWIVTSLCVATLVLSIALFVYTPGEGMQWTVFLGATLTLLFGEAVIRFAEREAANRQIVRGQE